MNLKHQIFTPENIVEDMLDKIEFHNNLYGKKILESSCGSGNILLSLVERYIVSSINEDYTLDEIKMGLENDIYAVEIDPNYYEKCLKKLEDLSGKFGIKEVDWNIINEDSLKLSWDMKFDYIIGNPPYIKYHDINKTEREFLRNKYKSCTKGNFDYYYAFFEEDFSNLDENGKMVYLIPSNMFKNVHADILRNMIKKSLVAIYDFTDKSIFQNILTSSSIIVIDNTQSNNYIEYHDVQKNVMKEIHKSSLTQKWIFEDDLEKKKRNSKFGDYFEASMTVATLLNEAYVLRNYEELEEYYQVNQEEIEKGLVRNAASPRSMFLNRQEKIVFPYYYNNDGLKRYSPEEFEIKFPQATKYFKQFKDRLAERNSSENTHWFEYGRTQALKHLNQPKLLMSTVITKKVKVYELDSNSIPYSGIYIIPKQNIGLEVAKEILETNEFFDYVKSIGINANSSSMRITARDIKNFPINKI